VSASVYIVAGPNGAGKTTFARKFLPKYAGSANFVNADMIAEGFPHLPAESAAFRAGRLMLEEIEKHARRRVDFAFETTLSGTSHLKLIRGLRDQGYEAHIFYLWVPGVDLALARIRDRVLDGGHNVPEPVVRRRFERSIKNFMCLYSQVVDFWMLFDNSGESPVMVALEKQGKQRIMERVLYENIVRRYGSV
jgi:predicted ABC-type ATPase